MIQSKYITQLQLLERKIQDTTEHPISLRSRHEIRTGGYL